MTGWSAKRAGAIRAISLSALSALPLIAWLFARDVPAYWVLVTAVAAALAIASSFASRSLHRSELSDAMERRERTALTERMTSLGTLAAGAAHEINNPLSYVLSNLIQAREELDRPDARIADVKDALADAEHGARRVRDIVRALSTFSLADDRPVSSVQVKRAVASAVDLTANELRHRAKLVLELADVPPVKASEAKLAQVVLNLVMNAAQAIPEGDVSKNEVRVKTRAAGNRVEIAVTDTGGGFPPEIAQRLFEPFFTTKPTGSAGLGLSICHGIVRALDGEILVESELGKGSTFRVLLPIADEVHEKTPVPAASKEGRLLVAVVDDEPLVAKAVQRMLERHHEVRVFLKGSDLLAEIGNGARFDAIVCDLMMPEVSGVDLHEKLAPELARSVIFMTGGAFTERAADFLAKVKNRRLDKPLDRELLLASVREVASH